MYLKHFFIIDMVLDIKMHTLFSVKHFHPTTVTKLFKIKLQYK